MKHFSNLAIVVLFSLLVGCADTHQLVRLSGNADIKLDINETVYISVPQDGIYGDKNYQGSGLNVTQMIQSSLAKHIRNIITGRQFEQFTQAINSAQNSGATYLVFPTILHWEDRATEWSGIPDRVELKLEIVDVETSKTISSSIINGTSGLSTFGGDHPQDLLHKPIEEYISSHY